MGAVRVTWAQITGGSPMHAPAARCRFGRGAREFVCSRGESSSSARVAVGVGGVAPEPTKGGVV